MSKDLNENAGGRSIAKGLFWKAAENIGDQLITFLVSVILARMLGPEKYGTLSLMLVFIAVANVIIQSGFQTALIQKINVTSRDLSSVFWIGLGISALLYGLLYAGAPFAADFFGDPEIGPMLRVLALILFFGAVISVETAIVARQMNFRAQFMATVAADIMSGAVGIVLAFRGYGTWALVFQQLIKNLVQMLLLLIFVGWHPSFCLDMAGIGELFSYGWKVLVSGLIDTVYNNIYTPVISKLYRPLTVGYYNRGNQFPQIIANSIGQTMQSVMLPAFSRSQQDKTGLRDMLRSTIKLSCFIMFPMMAGLAAVAEPLIGILLGEAWLPAAPILSLCCLSYAAWPMHVSNIQAINAQGRSDIYLKLEIIKKILGIAVLILSAPFGITVMIAMKGISDLFCTFINGAPNRGLLDYGPVKQWKDVSGSFLLAAAMGMLVYILGNILGGMDSILGLTGMPKELLGLALEILFGAAFYTGAAGILRSESLSLLIRTARSRASAGREK